jgi:hypothetical protein
VGPGASGSPAGTHGASVPGAGCTGLDGGLASLVRAIWSRAARGPGARNPPALWVIVDEWVLRRPVGGPHVMFEQVSRLIEAARQPTIVMEVIRAAVGAHTGLNGGGFAIADFEDAPSVGYQEGPLRGQPVRERKDVESLDLTWDTLRHEAEPRAASLAVLEEAAKSWTSAT